jgi:HSP20 family protein
MTLITRWEPAREFSGLQDRLNRMNRLFRESYSSEAPEEALTTTSFAPRLISTKTSTPFF